MTIILAISKVRSAEERICSNVMASNHGNRLNDTHSANQSVNQIVNANDNFFQQTRRNSICLRG